MNLPKKLNICGHDVTIKYSKKLFHNKSKIWGLYDDGARIIWLQNGMDKSRRAEVLLHEIMHAISYIHGFTLSEKAVNTLAIELNSVLKNNKLSIIKEVMK